MNNPRFHLNLPTNLDQAIVRNYAVARKPVSFGLIVLGVAGAAFALSSLLLALVG